jgi:hypothetical protein
MRKENQPLEAIYYLATLDLSMPARPPADPFLAAREPLAVLASWRRLRNSKHHRLEVRIIQETNGYTVRRMCAKSAPG